MSILLAVSGWDPEAWRARLKPVLPRHPVAILGESFDRATTRYALSWRHPPGSLADLPELRAIFSLGAGVDHLFADPALPDRPIVRVVDPDLRDRMSEWVVMHALIHLRQLKRYERQQRGRLWDDDPNQPRAAEVNAGVLGLGVMGMDAAMKLKALLAKTDILVVLLPLTEETRGILSASLFARLKQGGRLGGPALINAGRGGLQVEADILAALDSGALKGASLDVFEREPLPKDSRLWAHPAVFVSPHNAAVSSPEATAAFVARQIEAYERGEPLAHLVDRRRGY